MSSSEDYIEATGSTRYVEDAGARRMLLSYAFINRDFGGMLNALPSYTEIFDKATAPSRYVEDAGIRRML